MRRRKRIPITATKGRTTRRLQGLKLLFVLGAAAVLLRTYTLQMTSNKSLDQLATRQHDRTITVHGARGSILDRNQVPLAVSLPAPSAFVNPRLIRGPKTLAPKIAAALRLPKERVLKALTSDRYFAWIKRQMTPQEYDRLTELVPDGLGSIQESRRSYPHGTLAAQVLGFVGIEGNGLEGIERRYEKLLDGGEHTVHVPHDARGKVIDWGADLSTADAFSGVNVVLTIDQTLQHIAERELETAVLSAKAKAGQVVVMQPDTGEILAMATYPTFDPNGTRRSSPGDLRNRPVTDVFEPGSLFKVFVMAQALEDHLVGANEKIYCENGTYRIKGKVIHDVKPHGYLTPAEIIKYSSNIGMFKIAERFKAERLYALIRKFGFGEKTGVGLGGEARGILRTPGEWHGVMQGNLGFGQGIATTNLQIARGYAAIANGGFLVRPRMVRALTDSSGRNIGRPFERDIVRQTVSVQEIQQITELMVGVTQTDGSGALAAVPGFEVAGKTGTSQKPDGKGGYSKELYVSSFAGFIPARDPKLVISVAIDEPEGEIFGGAIAAPVFRRIAEQGLSHLNAKPNPALLARLKPLQDAHQASVVAVQNLGAKALAQMEVSLNRELSTLAYKAAARMPDVRGLTLREAMKTLSDLSLQVHVAGRGVIVEQMPRPGEILRPNGKCVLTAKPTSRSENLSDAHFSRKRI